MPKQDVGELLPYALRCNVGDSVWFYVWYELRSLCTVGRQCIQQMAAPRPEDRLKVVVRGLPPALTREAFVTLIERCCGYTWLAFYPGKSSSKRSVPSCAFVAFACAEDLAAFCATFHGHVFVGTRGVQHAAAVEYAPYQRVPVPPARRLTIEGTIDAGAALLRPACVNHARSAPC